MLHVDSLLLIIGSKKLFSSKKGLQDLFSFPFLDFKYLLCMEGKPPSQT